MLPRFFTPDHLDLIALLNRHEVDFLLVGGIAVNYYGYSRSTGNVDFFYRADSGNADSLYAALGDFFGDGVPGISEPSDLLKPGLIIQLGVPPHRIDFINEVSGLEFETAWSHRILEHVEGEDEEAIEVPIIRLDDLLANKRASGRPKDEDDLQYLSELSDQDE